jgi:hypothetical protein
MLAAVLAQLAVKVAAAAPGAVLYTGPDAGDDRASQPLAVVLGDDGDPASDAVATEETEPASMGGGLYRRGAVPCAVASWSGDTDMAPRLAEADAVLDAIAAAVGADPGLGGLVLHSTYAGSSAIPLQTENGATALAQFTITYIGQTA